MTRRNRWFIFRRDPKTSKMVEDLMKGRKFVSYSELFRALIRRAWKSLQGGKKG